jgi:hypothetical protein
MKILGWMTMLLLITIVNIGIGVRLLHAQSPPPPPAYHPTEVQSLRLKVAQQAAQLAQVQLREAQQQFQQAMSSLSAEADKVKQENKWPEDVQFNLDSLQFTKVAKPIAQPAPKKEPSK